MSRPVQDPDSTEQAGTPGSGETHPGASRRTRIRGRASSAGPGESGGDLPAPRSRRWRRLLVPAVMLLVAGFFILRDRVPAFDSQVQRLIDPTGWRATETCVRVALGSGKAPAFSRLLGRGHSSATQGGYYVANVLVGEMGDRGREVRISVSCYLDAGGEVVRIMRESQPAAAARPNPFPPSAD